MHTQFTVAQTQQGIIILITQDNNNNIGRCLHTLTLQGHASEHHCVKKISVFFDHATNYQGQPGHDVCKHL